MQQGKDNAAANDAAAKATFNGLWNASGDAASVVPPESLGKRGEAEAEHVVSEAPARCAALLRESPLRKTEYCYRT